MNLTDITNTVTYHTNAIANVGNTDSKEAAKWIAETAGNDKFLTEHLFSYKRRDNRIM